MAAFKAAYKKKKLAVRGGDTPVTEPAAKKGKASGSGKGPSADSLKKKTPAAEKKTPAQIPAGTKKKIAPYLGGGRDDEPIGTREKPVLPSKCNLASLKRCLPPNHAVYRDPTNERSLFFSEGCWGGRVGWLETEPARDKRGSSALVLVVIRVSGH